MKKVLHVITDTNIGGAGRYLLNLLKYGDPARYAAAVACPGGGELQRQIQEAGIQVFELKGGEKSFRLSHLKELKRIISEGGFEIIHTHASFSGRIAGKLSGCKVVFTRHSIGKIKKDVFSKLAANMGTKVFADAVIAVSRAVKVSMIEMGIPAKMIKVIHNGIDLSFYDNVGASLRQEYNIPGNVKIVGTVARLVPEKGVEYSIKAMPYILRGNPGTRLVIIGDGYLKQSLLDLSIRLGVEDEVMFLGYRRNVEAIISDFDVFMMPSMTEGLSLALLEVMALGKPVVATEVGGNPEVIRTGVNGLLVPPGDEGALARGVGEMLSRKEEARALGMKARETVKESFNAGLMAAKTMDIYDGILRKAGTL